jgi:hypothetical protein
VDRSNRADNIAGSGGYGASMMIFGHRTRSGLVHLGHQPNLAFVFAYNSIPEIRRATVLLLRAYQKMSKISYRCILARVQAF